MLTYLLRDIDDKLWSAVKKRATNEGHSIKWVIVQLLTKYIKEGI